MVEIIDKVVDKAKNAKDKVVDAAKDSVSSSPSSSQSSFSQSQEKNYKDSDQGTETKRIQVPLNAHIKEESLAPEDVKIDATQTNPAAVATQTNPAAVATQTNPAAVATQTNPAAVATQTNPAISINQVNQKNNSYKENKDFFNPFLIGIKLWQSYSTIWMDFYKEMLNYNTGLMRNFRN